MVAIGESSCDSWKECGVCRGCVVVLLGSTATPRVGSMSHGVNKVCMMCRLTVVLKGILLFMFVFNTRADAPWESGTETIGQSSLPREVVELFEQACVLSPDQRLLAEEFHAAHLAAMREFMETKIRPALRDADEVIKKAIKQDEGNPRQPNIGPARTAREAALAPLADRQAAMDREFLDTLRSLLTEEQKHLWEPFLWRVNRVRYLSRGAWYPEQPIDLLTLLEEIDISPAEVVDAPAYDNSRTAYARQLDAAIMRRVELDIGVSRHLQRDLDAYNQATRHVPILDESGREIGLAMADPAGVEAYRRKNAERALSHRAIRDINRVFRVEFANHLTPDAVARFHEAFDEAVLGRYWTPANSLAFRFVDELRTAGILNADQETAITSVLDGFKVQMRHNSRLTMKADESRLDASWDTKSELAGNSQAIMALQQEVMKLMQDRVDAEYHTVEVIWSMLTPEQREKVKKPERKQVKFR